MVHEYSLEELFFKDFSRIFQGQIYIFQGLIFHSDHTLTELPEVMNRNVWPYTTQYEKIGIV